MNLQSESTQQRDRGRFVLARNDCDRPHFRSDDVSYDPPRCPKLAYVTGGLAPHVKPNRAERRRQKRLKLAPRCGLHAGHKGGCQPGDRPTAKDIERETRRLVDEDLARISTAVPGIDETDLLREYDDVDMGE